MVAKEDTIGLVIVSMSGLAMLVWGMAAISVSWQFIGAAAAFWFLVHVFVSNSQH